MLRFISVQNHAFSGGRISRRGFLKAGTLAAASLLPGGAGGVLLPSERTLAFYNTHTGESLKTVYRTGAEYLPEALSDINRILRDHHTGEIRPMEVGLLDLLHALKERLDARRAFHIISGYRSPATNALLRKKKKGVAENSLHLVGKAIDIHLPGCTLGELRRAAMWFKKGGVGYYPQPGFVHVDVGRVRHW